MARYLVLIAYPGATWEQATPEVQQAYFDAHAAFEAYVDERGRRISSAPLAGPQTATTIRGGDTVTDGPFVETVEAIGGYYDIEVPDLDVAIAAARLLPAAYAVEIRPTLVIERS